MKKLKTVEYKKLRTTMHNFHCFRFSFWKIFANGKNVNFK